MKIGWESLVSHFQHPENALHSSVFSEIGNARCIVKGKYRNIAVHYLEEMRKPPDRGLTKEGKKHRPFMI